MKALLAKTVLIQSIGVVASFGLTFVVANLGGPAVQGAYSVYKSLYDFQVILLLFGLPSGIVYYVNKTRSSISGLFYYTNVYAFLAFFPLAFVDWFMLPRLMPHGLLQSFGVYPALLLAAGTSLILGYSLHRALILTVTDGTFFSLLSIAPAIALLLGIPATILIPSIPMSSAYLASGLLCFGLTYGYLRRHRSNISPTVIRWGIIARQSLHVFAQGLLYTAQPLLTIGLLQWAGASADAIGHFNIASMLVVAPNLLVAMVAPVLYNRWSKSLDLEQMLLIARKSIGLSALIQLGAILFIPFIPRIIALVVGPEFAPSTRAATILIFAMFPVVWTRTITPALQGGGFNTLVTQSCAARLAMTLLPAPLLLTSSLPPLQWAALAWVAGEYAASAVCALTLFRRGRSSSADRQKAP